MKETTKKGYNKNDRNASGNAAGFGKDLGIRIEANDKVRTLIEVTERPATKNQGDHN